MVRWYSEDLLTIPWLLNGQLGSGLVKTHSEKSIQIAGRHDEE